MKQKNLFLILSLALTTGLLLFISSCKKEDPDPPAPVATTIQIVTGAAQSADAGSPLANPVEVIVKDQDGMAFVGAKVSFTVTEGSASSGTVNTNSEGKASSIWTLGSTIGTQTMIVTGYKADGTTPLSTSPLTINATAKVKIIATSIELVSGGDQTADVESALENPIIVVVKDQDGDVFPGATVFFAVAEGSLSSSSETTDANGNASVTWTTGSTIGQQTLTVTAFKADGTTALTGSPLTVNATGVAKDANSIELFSGGDQTEMINNSLSENIVLIVKDANGNPIEGIQVNFNTATGNGSVPNSTMITDADGYVSTSWRLGPTLGTQTLTVTAFKSDGTTPLTGSPLSVNATATSLLAERLYLMEGEDQTGKVGIVLLDPIVVKVFGSGTFLPGETVYFEVAEGSVSPASAVTDEDGLASTIWTLGPTVGIQTLTVTAFKADGITHLEDSPLLINATAEESNDAGTVTDYDGNVYPAVKIGDQIWMAENLKVTHYSDGTAISNVVDGTEWNNLALTDKAYSYENNSVDSDYGIFYTHSAAVNGAGSSDSNPSGIQGVCPVGWHIPSVAEFDQLTLSGNANVLKETGTTHWLAPNDSNNETGFTALGGGFRNSLGQFIELKESGNWWSSEIRTNYPHQAFGFEIGLTGFEAYSTIKSLDSGLSVRCVKD